MISSDESDIRLTDLSSSMSRRGASVGHGTLGKVENNLRSELRRSATVKHNVTFQATPKRQAPLRPTDASGNGNAVDSSPINSAENLNATRYALLLDAR